MPNPYVVSLDQQELRVKDYRRVGSNAIQTQRMNRPREGHRRVYVPRREAVVEVLAQAEMLPAIYFVFSRAGCDRSVQWLRESGLRLTTRAEADRIRDRAESRAAWIDEEDLVTLGFYEFLDGLTAGVAAHHAGMLPVFKETVEELFEAGLVKVVFATETLSLGINMPARTVVIEDLWKFQGERHEILTPGEYTQLTGRAGTARYRPARSRGRGVPAAGAVRTGGGARGDPDVRPQLVVPPVVQHGGQPRAQLRPRASAPAAQLVVRAVPGRPRRRPAGAPARARSGVARRIPDEPRVRSRRLRRVLGPAAARRSASARRTAAAASGSAWRRSGRSSPACDPGEVIHVPRTRRRGLAVVLSSRDGKPTVLSEDRSYFRLSAQGLRRSADRADPDRAARGRGAPGARGTGATSPRSWCRCTSSVHASPGTRPTRRSSRRRWRWRPRAAEHPCASCPERAKHERWAVRADTLEAQLKGVQRRIQIRTETLARQFDRVLAVLRGARVRRRTGRSRRRDGRSRGSTVRATCWSGSRSSSGLFDDLSPSELASLVSTVVYESRERVPSPGELPDRDDEGPVRAAGAHVPADPADRGGASGRAQPLARRRVRHARVPLGRGQAARGRAGGDRDGARRLRPRTANS